LKGLTNSEFYLLNNEYNIDLLNRNNTPLILIYCILLVDIFQQEKQLTV